MNLEGKMIYRTNTTHHIPLTKKVKRVKGENASRIKRGEK